MYGLIHLFNYKEDIYEENYFSVCFSSYSSFGYSFNNKQRRRKKYGGRKIRFANTGINVRGQSRQLKVNYRTTEEIRKAAFALLNGISFDDLDDDIEYVDL